MREERMLEGSSEEADRALPTGIISRLKSDQLKFCNLVAYGVMDRQEIAQHMGVSKIKLTRWSKDPDVQIYIEHLKRQGEMSISTARDKANRNFFSQVSLELASRFDEPDHEADLPLGASEWQVKQYEARFAKNAAFKDLAKVFMDHQKVASELEVGGEVGAGESLVMQIRGRFQKKMMMKREQKQKFQDIGFDPEAMFDVNVLEMNPDGTFTPADRQEFDVVEEEIIEIEAFSIFRKGDL